MKTLLIMRHAKSSRDDEGMPDHERPLNKRGQHDAPRVGGRLADEDLAPDAVVCSTAVRARETAEAVAEAAGYEGKIAAHKELYGAGPEAYYEVLSRLPRDPARALVVGHNPDVEDLLLQLTGKAERMPTAAVAHVALPINTWGELEPSVRGRLEAVWRPKEMD